MTNPRDLINLQNALWDAHTRWLNGEAPQFSQQNPMPYWGWNEVPVDKDVVDSPGSWDAVMIKLPPWLNSVNQLGGQEKIQLERDLATWETQGKIVPGSDKCRSRPGSYIVLVRELQSGSDFSRQFYCENWSRSPSGWYKFVYVPPSSRNKWGACFIDKPHNDVMV